MSAIFDKGIKITNSEDATAQKVTVQSTDGTLAYQSNLTFEKLSTGLLTGGIITINADTTKYNVSATTGLVSNFSNPNLPVFKTVSYAGITGKVSAYLATSNITYIGLDENGVLLEQVTPFTTSQDRDIISLGAVIHSNRTNINTVNNIGLPTVGASNQLHDLMEAIGALNLSGNKFSANGANLKLNKSAGVLFKLGSNAQNDWKNPHQIAQGATTALTFRYRTQTGAEGLDITDLDPSKYDLSGVLTTVPPNKYTIQTITLFQAGAVRIQYGQNIYNTLDEAEKAIATRSFVAESNIAQNGVNRGYVIMKHNTSSLQNASDAKLIEVTKFGGLSSGGLALTFANITAALGYTPEDASNKQNSLATDGTGVKFPTVDAVNSSLATKANDNNVVHLNGTETITGAKTFSAVVSVATNINSSTNNLILSDTNGVAFRTIRASSWTDSVNARFFQIGTLSENIAFTTQGGNNAARMSFFANAAQFSSGGYLATTPAVGVFEVCNATTKFFNIFSTGNATIGSSTDNNVDKLQVAGSIKTTSSVQVGDNVASASASNEGAIRYRKIGNNSYAEMCMQTGASTYTWTTIVEHNW